MKNPPHLRDGDCRLLTGFGVLFFLAALFASPQIGANGAGSIQSAIEMRASGDWLLPSVGGAPLLEHPPVAQWLALLVASTRLMGIEAASRLVCVTALVLMACLAATVAAVVFGRRTGLLAGLTTMTTASLVYAVGGCHADLVSSVALLLAVASYLHCERDRKNKTSESSRLPGSLISGRSRKVLLFFSATAIATFVCGTTVAAIALLVPIVFTLSTGRDVSPIRRFLWLWGAVAVLAAGIAWPLIVCLRVPGASLLLWPTMSLTDWLDYVSLDRLKDRVTVGVVCAFTVSVSWGLLMPLGLWWTRHETLGDRGSSERLLVAFAISGPAAAAFCLDEPRPVLIAAVALWNILAAVGIERTVEAGLQAILAMMGRARLNWSLPSLPMSRLTMGSAFACFAGVFVPLLWSDALQFRPIAAYHQLLDQEVEQLAPAERIAIDMEVGDEATVALVRLKARGRPLHNLSFLLDGPPPPNGVLVLTRFRALDSLRRLGNVTDASLDDSESTGDELVLCRVRVNPALCRRSTEAVPMTLAQATHREAGPWLGDVQVSSRSDVWSEMNGTGEAESVRR